MTARSATFRRDLATPDVSWLDMNVTATLRRAYDARMYRPWRVVFVVYAVLLIVATHWPNLVIGEPGEPSPDKLLHFGASAVFVILLRLTGWCRSAVQAVGLGLLFVVVDELTQATLAVGRQWSRADIAAGILGTVCAGTWLLAFQEWPWTPLHLKSHRRRLMHALAIECADAKTWTRTVPAIVIVAATAMGIVVVLLRLGSAGDITTVHAGIAVVVGLMVGTGVTFAVLPPSLRRRLEAHDAARTCQSCGASCAKIAIDASGNARCAACQATQHATQWCAPVRRSTSERRASHFALRACVFVPASALVSTIVGILLLNVIIFGTSTWSLTLTSGAPVDVVVMTTLSTTLLAIWALLRAYLQDRLAPPSACMACDCELDGHSPAE